MCTPKHEYTLRSRRGIKQSTRAAAGGPGVIFSHYKILP